MNVKEKNDLFLQGKWDIPGLFPQLEELSTVHIPFEVDFGLKDLPTEPGLILVRGARQLGKSTWLESSLKKTLEQFGPGSAFYVNGDELLNQEALYSELKQLIPLFSPKASVFRIFVDEITAVPEWEKALKRLYDSGDSRHILIVTTGSKAIDLRKGTETLPGRRGKLARTQYLFTPLSYTEFQKRCQSHFNENTLVAYLITGGSPLAANELVKSGHIAPYIISLTRDWILGECAALGRSRNTLTWVAQEILKQGGKPVSLAKLAREAGLANNSVIQGYLDVLVDLLCVSIALPVDPNKMRPIPRKPFKFHWTYPLAAIAFCTTHIHSIDEFQKLPFPVQGQWFEWLVAQELFRKAAIAGEAFPEMQFFWQNPEHEIDFVVNKNTFMEVKRGRASPMEFQWFTQIFPNRKLIVINSDPFETANMVGMTFEAFLKMDTIA